MAITCANGFSMIDALFALVITSCGCLGLLGYQWQSIKHYQHQQLYQQALNCLDELSQAFLASTLTSSHDVPPLSCQSDYIAVKKDYSEQHLEIIVEVTPHDHSVGYHLVRQL